MTHSVQKSYISGRNVQALLANKAPKANSQGKIFDSDDIKVLSQGNGIDLKSLGIMDEGDLISTPTSGTASVPLRFIQHILVGAVYNMTQARKADICFGTSIVGEWKDEEVQQQFLKLAGKPVAYGDYVNPTLSDYNSEWEGRTIVRFTTACRVDVLEQERASSMQVDAMLTKRMATFENLEILRNLIAFNGYNAGNNRTYGILNDPNLGAYLTLPATGTGNARTWASKGYVQLTNDIIYMVGELRKKMGDNFESDYNMTLEIASSLFDRLHTTELSVGGRTVKEFIEKNYPNMRIVTVSQFDGADANANVMYLHLDSIANNGTDDGAVITQVVPTKLRLLGIRSEYGTVAEQYSNATAGVFVKRPTGVVRFTGA